MSKIKKKIISVLFGTTVAVIPFLATACFNLHPYQYLSATRKNGYLKTTVDLNSTNQQISFVSTFLFQNNKGFYFLTKTNQSLIDAFNNQQNTKIKLTTPIYSATDQRYHELLANDKIEVITNNANYMIYKIKNITSSQNAIKKILSPQDQYAPSIKPIADNTNIDYKYLNSYVPLDIDEFSNKNYLDEPMFFVKGYQDSKVVKKEGNLITFKTKGKINDQYLGSPLFYHMFLVGFLISYKNNTDPNTNEDTNEATFYLFTKKDFDIIGKAVVLSYEVK